MKFVHRVLPPLFMFVLLLSGVAFAIPQSTLPCVQGPLTGYIALGATGCQIGDKIFSNFSYAASAQHTLPVYALGVTVTPIDNPFDAQIDFNAFWSALPHQITDAVLRFRVNVVANGDPITQVDLFQGGSFALGTGIASVAETLCGGDLLPACASGESATLSTYYTGFFGSNLFDSTLLNPTFSVDVLKDIGVTGGLYGFAYLSHVEQHFIETPGGGGGGEVPEPGTVILLGSGLIGLFFFGRYRNQLTMLNVREK